MYSICCFDELLAKVNKNLKLAKENRENVSTCTNFHDITQIVMWRLQFCFRKKSFLKTRHSSPVTL